MISGRLRQAERTEAGVEPKVGFLDDRAGHPGIGIPRNLDLQDHGRPPPDRWSGFQRKPAQLHHVGHCIGHQATN